MNAKHNSTLRSISHTCDYSVIFLVKMNGEGKRSTVFFSDSFSRRGKVICQKDGDRAATTDAHRPQ